MMTMLRVIVRRLAGLAARRRDDAEFDEEIRGHLELLQEDFERQGLPSDQARLAARRAFGGAEQMKERRRDTRGIPAFDRLAQDVRYALRALRRHPGFAAVSVLIMALGIGANSAIFSVVDALMLRQLPVDRPGDLVVFASHGDGPMPNTAFSYPLYQDFRAAGRSFSGMAISAGTQRRLMSVASPTAQPEPIDVEVVSGNYLPVVGVRPALGRVLAASDDELARPLPVVVLSHGFWQRRFGGHAGILGTRMSVDGIAFTIVGVASERFRGFEVGDEPDAWLPLLAMAESSREPLARMTTQRNTEWLLIVGRLRPDVARRSAQAEMSVVFQRDLEETVRRRSGAGRPLGDAERARLLQQRLELAPGATGSSELRLRFARPLQMLVIGVGAVLLIACANIASMLLARGEARRQEITVRLALGASRPRLMRQLLTESLVLALIGGAAGLLVGSWGSGVLVSFVPDPDITLRAGLDGRVLLFTFTVSTLAGIVFGVGPAFSLSRHTPRVESASMRHTAPRRPWVQGALVASQVALTLIVLYSAGLFARTLFALQSVDLGFQPEQLTVFRVSAPPGTPPARRTAIYRDIVNRIEQQPGVISASVSLFGLLSNMNSTQRVSVPGHVPTADEPMTIRRSYVEPGFFDTTGITILEGRAFDEQDAVSGRSVAVIDRTMARRYFGGRAIGRRFGIMGPSGPEGDGMEVIGVAADARYRYVREEPTPTVYSLLDERSARIGVPAIVEIRTSASSQLDQRTILRVVGEVEPDALVTNAASMMQVLDRAMAQERLLSTLTSLFGVLALIVAAVGLYGVRSFSVTSRTREIGVRLALGASRALLLRSLIGQGMVMAAAGASIGGGAVFFLTRFVEAVLYAVEPGDPATIIGVTIVLGLSTLLASYVPARRATRIDPAAVLRNE
jgi:predicted permease